MFLKLFYYETQPLNSIDFKPLSIKESLESKLGLAQTYEQSDEIKKALDTV